MNRIAGGSTALPHGRDYYEVLGLVPGAEGADVGFAYWRLAREFHARASKEPWASVLLDELNEAAAVLGSPATRRHYDKRRQQSIPRGSGPAAFADVTVHPRPHRRWLLALLVAMAGVASAPMAMVPGRYRPAMIPGATVTAAPIIFLGDSVTSGAGASSADASFTRLLQARLDQAGYVGAGDYDSVISALGGQAVDLRFAQDVARQPRSLVVVEVGAHSVVEDSRLPAQQYALSYGSMLDCLLGTGATVVVSTVPWLDWDQANPVYIRAAERSAIIRDEAGKRGVAVADVWNVTKDRRDLVSSDGFHPNDAGHRLIADLFWHQIEPQLGRPRGAFHDGCEDDRALTLRALQPDAAVRIGSGG